jgi:hypothetical protein
MYVGDDVEVWVEYQGWLPAVLVRVHPTLIVQRPHTRLPEPCSRNKVRRAAGK